MKNIHIKSGIIFMENQNNSTLAENLSTLVSKSWRLFNLLRK